MMFSGIQPFDEENVAKLVHNITTEDPDYSDPSFNEISIEGKDLMM